MSRIALTRLSLRQLSRGIIATTMAATVVLTLALAYIAMNMEVIEDTNEDLSISADPYNNALASVAFGLGYGGLIHSFKNAVIRGGQANQVKAHRRAGAVLAGLEDIEALKPEAAPHVAQIRETVEAYEKEIDKVYFLRSVKTSPERIDAEISIDDGPAWEAMLKLVELAGSDGNLQRKVSFMRWMRGALGYNGAIHHFKDYLIRKDPADADRARESFESARGLLGRYRSLAETKAETRALDAINTMIDDYIAALDIAAGAIAEGRTTEEIDNLVSVDDGPALAALATLSNAMLIQNDAQNDRLRKEVTAVLRVSTILAIFTAVAGVVISIGVAIILSRGAVNPAGRIAESMKELAAGNTEVEFPDSNDRTEIGIIAGVAGQFGETLRTVQRLNAEAEAHSREQEEMAADQRRLLEKQKQLQAQMERDSKELAARQAKQTDLQTRIASAVTAATEGDFSARIDTTFGEEDLDRLAAHFNDLMMSVDRGVSALAAVTRDMARGELSVQVEGEFRGAFARLQEGFNDALREICGLVDEVLRSAGSIDGEAGAIASASADLSRRTETQAATLEETAAAITELAASVKSVADNAGDARRMANKAGDVADESGTVVDSAVAAMDRIVTSSSKISKVTALIDDIAFQTNLLALNAGVEAARAGESGRGFAVVATEVRALAHRSSDAAKEINGLIAASEGEIGAGADKISKAGDSIREIASYVTRLREAIDSVANATSEQSTSLEEVNAAMLQLDSVTQQNVAMFEETTASTAALRSRSAELVQAGSRFSTADDGRGPDAFDGGSGRAAMLPKSA
ncbi:MAG: methyl-accepting chemotaxis protein [Pseudooceanicola sp.]